MSDARKWRTASAVAGIRAIVNHEENDIMENEATNDRYRFDATSMSVDDGDLVLKPANLHASLPGRWIKANSKAANEIYFGSGGDGSLDFDGTSDVLGITPAAGVYTLSRCIHGTDILVQASAKIDTNGYRIFATGTLTVNGEILCDGNDAVAEVAGTSRASGLVVAGFRAGGGGQTGAGQNGFDESTGGVCGDGGDGGGGSGGSGGTGGTTTAYPAANGGPHEYATLTSMISGKYGTSRIYTGSGGGGGGGNTTNEGGGGGGCAGHVLICAKTIVGTGSIHADGGDGAAGTATDCGGGGGGAGGLVVIITSACSITPRADGGIGGSGGGGAEGIAGVNGDDGITKVVIV